MSIADKLVPAAAIVGVACIFSENARLVTGKAFSLAWSTVQFVAPAVDATVPVVTSAVRMAGDGIYYAGYYGYETVATAINNIDLIVAGGATLTAATLAARALGNRTGAFNKARNVAVFGVAGLAVTAAVYATATKARKLGYEIGLPQLTETGAAITDWGRKKTGRVRKVGDLVANTSKFKGTAQELTVVMSQEMEMIRQRAIVAPFSFNCGRDECTTGDLTIRQEFISAPALPKADPSARTTALDTNPTIRDVLRSSMQYRITSKKSPGASIKISVDMSYELSQGFLSNTTYASNRTLSFQIEPAGNVSPSIEKMLAPHTKMLACPEATPNGSLKSRSSTGFSLANTGPLATTGIQGAIRSFKDYVNPDSIVEKDGTCRPFYIRTINDVQINIIMSEPIIPTTNKSPALPASTLTRR